MASVPSSESRSGCQWRGGRCARMAGGGAALRRANARTSRLAGAALAVLLVAGCAGGTTTYRSEAAGSPSAQTYAPYAAMNGVNQLVIRNNPYPTDPDGQVLLSIVQTHNPMQRYHFTLGAGPQWNGYTVIFGYGESPVGNQDLCKNVALPLRPMPPGQTAVMADLCYGPLLITEVYGHTQFIADPHDPRLAALVGGVMEDLFALRTPPYHVPRAPFVLRP
jgi:hypothetical protein